MYDGGPTEMDFEQECGTPMLHPDETVSPCILPKYHEVVVEDSAHWDVHGHEAPVLVHQSTIREIQRVQRNREAGLYE